MTGACGVGWHRWKRVNCMLLRCARGCGAEAVFSDQNYPKFPPLTTVNTKGNA